MRSKDWTERRVWDLLRAVDRSATGAQVAELQTLLERGAGDVRMVIQHVSYEVDI